MSEIKISIIGPEVFAPGEIPAVTPVAVPNAEEFNRAVGSKVIFVVDCVYRTRINHNENTGDHSLHCGNSLCEHNGKEVTYRICAFCPLRKDGAQTVIPVPTPTAPPSEPRPDLAAIALTLPAPNPEKDAERTFQRPIFHADGRIEYPRRDKDWEPPQNINGYVRDPDNKWVFHPLWVPCAFRHQTAFLKANCGCIDVICRCNSPQSPMFAQRLAHETCANCPVRKK
jgi:hypothetical protein